MSLLDKAVSQRNDDRKAFVEQKKATMAALFADIDAMLPVAMTKAVYPNYLALQAKNPNMRPNNLLLVLKQLPGATHIGSVDRWNRLGRSLVPNPARLNVLAPDPYQTEREVTNVDRATGEVTTRMVSEERTGYKMGIMFDIANTHGRELPAMPVLEEGSTAMESALTALLTSTRANVVIEPNPKKGFTARYEPATRTIHVASGLPDQQAFAALAREIAHAEFGANKGSSYDRTAHEVEAVSAAQVVCARYGVPAEALRLDAIEAWAQTKDRESIRATLSDIHAGARRMINPIDRAIAPQELQPLRQEQQRPQQARDTGAR